MGILSRTRTICMAPSVELWQPEASHMGNIAERMMARDYRIETGTVSIAARVPLLQTVGEFVDTGSLKDYKQCLRLRHPLEVNQAVLAGRNDFKIPDISTWRGEYRERTLGVSHLSGEKQGPRSEHYEIKPDNIANEALGQLKLARIALDNRDLGLTNLRLRPGYERGTWYPPEARSLAPGVRSRKIRFTHTIPVARTLLRTLKRWEGILTRVLGAPLGIRDFWLDVVRRQPGLLLYKICFKLDVPDDCTEELEDALAAKLVRLVYEHLLLGLTPQEQAAELTFVASLRTLRAQRAVPRATPDPKIAAMNAALDAEPRFDVAFGQMVDEVEPLQQQIRQVLLTRNRGMIGDIYLVCCDATFLRQEVTSVRTRAFERNVQMLRGLYGPTTPDYSTGMTFARAGMLMGQAAVDDITSGRLAADVTRWIQAHPTELIVAGTMLVALTAAVLIVVTAGAAAPIVVPLTEAVLVETAVAVEGAAAAGIVTGAGSVATVTVEGAVVTASATGAGVATGSGVAATTGAGVGVALDVAGLTESQLLALRVGIGMREAQAAVAIGVRAASTAALSDGVLTAGSAGVGATQGVAMQQLSANVVGAALLASGGERERGAMVRGLTPAVFAQWRDAIVAAGPTVAALSSSQLMTTGIPTSPVQPGASAAGQTCVILGLGKMYLLKLRLPKGEMPELPKLEQEFGCATLSEEYSGRLHYLGFVRCL